ncbi:cob(I)yrinic acid a,c-diamide adenosyltransferase [Patescibacteria group bacterium]
MTKNRSKKFKAFTKGVTIACIGDGKGKTSAAIGIATRARGYGKRVLFLQFFKSPEWPSGERAALKKLGVKVKVYGEGFVGIMGDKKKRTVHKQAALKALEASWKAIISGKYDVIIMDEAISCLEQKLFSPSHLVEVLKSKTESKKGSKVHLVLTGHKRYPTVLKYCDVVTDMKMVKHPYSKGFLAVKGIDF